MEHPSLLRYKHVPFWYRYIVKPLYTLLLPIMIPFKLIFGLTPIILSAICDTLLNMGTDPAKPLSKNRLFLYRLEKYVLYRVGAFFCGIVIVRKGKPNRSVRMMAANHQAAIDILVVAGTGVDSAISKAGIAKNPIFGPTLRVTRSYLARAGANAQQELQKRFEGPQVFPAIGCFPGGTTTSPHVQPRFRSGTFMYKPSIQLVTINYKSYENLCYSSESGPNHIKNLILCPLAIAEITYHEEVYTWNGSESAQEYANRMGEEVAKFTGGVYTEYNFKDCLWWSGNDKLEAEVSEVYKRDHGWRGQYKDWKPRCLKLGLNPLICWPKEKIEALEAKKLK
ncbi:Lyso-PAF_acetyltransferase / Lysophosphatidylcholine acyltransferase [Hexamita inflata]|uniref:Lyso-PAF acetyltransferase / Lysophosphatidylcholine acyltransferase n=1 Tax=Hexamita inflata TaxID=28002 RepID=A0AA86UW85_9EUKA|nr:Lyso-PAF acetyltransferase / Lysophosphatidylcholine acyltransferase [Hexamita inflata]CAI9970434.1 Lyso-PAF acetyltransferase / Lysophosphatidylcholine acyltransferase [Hexamita inflata]